MRCLVQSLTFIITIFFKTYYDRLLRSKAVFVTDDFLGIIHVKLKGLGICVYIFIIIYFITL